MILSNASAISVILGWLFITIIEFNFLKFNFVVNERMSTPRRGNLLLAQGRMERSGMAPWVSRTTHKNNALQGQKPDYM